MSSSTSSTSSSSSSSSASFVNGRYWGLATGLDVDSIVSALVSDKQSQIDKANQDTQKLQWKQTAYRSLIGAINTFQNSFLSMTGSNTMLSSSTYKAYAAASSNTAISVQANSDAVAGDHSITVYQSAVAGALTGSNLKGYIAGGSAPTQASLTNTNFNMTVDGVQKNISFSDTDDYSDIQTLVQNKIDSAFGSGKVSVYKDTSGDLSFSANSGNATTISVANGNTSGGSGNALTALNMTSGASATAEVSGVIKGTSVPTEATLKGSNFYITVDGVTKNINFSNTDDYSNIQSLIQNKINNAFGVSKVSVFQDTAGHISMQENSLITSSISVASGDTTNGATDSLSALGIASGSSNRLNISSSLTTLFGDKITAADSGGNFNVSINGISVALNKNDSLSTTFSKINSSNAGVKISYSQTTNKITMTSNKTGAASTINAADTDTNGVSNGFFNTLFGGSASVTYGQDAIFTVDGLNMTRDSNNFTIDGITYNINKNISSSDTPQTANVTLTNDVSSTVSAVQKFVDAYNGLLESIYSQTQTKYDKDYQPLTDTQKKSMTDDEISDWNKKAQQGLLFDDDTLDGITSQMRSVMYEKVTTTSGKTISLYDLGITTSDDYTKGGELVVNTQKLTDAINNDPDAVAQLFSQKSSINYRMGGSDQNDRLKSEGVAYRLQDIMKNATSTGAYTGTLISLAGSDGDTLEDNTINTQLKELSDKITEYKTQMTDKKNLLYKEFENLETFMQKMNSQSSMISSFGG